MALINSYFTNNFRCCKFVSSLSTMSPGLSNTNCIESSAKKSISKGDDLKNQPSLLLPYCKKRPKMFKCSTALKQLGLKRNKSDSFIHTMTNHQLNVCNRLYNYGFLTKKRIEKKRDEQYERIKNASQMLNKANSSITNLFNKSTCFTINKQKPRSNHHQHKKIQSYSFLLSNPTRNKPQHKDAKSLQVSSKKFSKQKKRLYLPSLEQDDDIKRKRKQVNNSQEQSNLDYLTTLYQKGVIQYKKIELNHHNNLEKQTNEYQLYTFKPNLSATSNSLSTIHINNKRHNKPIYQQQADWQSFVENKTSIRKGIEELEESYICTFKPKTIGKRLKNDEQFIKKYLTQINNYVFKRRKTIQRHCLPNKETKKFSRNTFSPQEGYTNNKLNSSNKGSTDKIADQKPLIRLHCSNDDFKRMTKPQVMNSIDSIEYMRRSLNIKQFFEGECL